MILRTLILGASASLLAFAAHAEAITIATVNNGDMIRMQKLTDDFTAKNPGIELNWVTLEENVLRERVTTDIATKGGQYDVLTIGTYEVPIWGKQNWLLPLDNLGADYAVDDLIPSIRSGLTVDGKLYAAPFYGESSFTMYRKDLIEKAGLTMSDAPTWDAVADAARKMTDRANGINGICLRGKAGWGENMALLTAMSNSFGARWFDEQWKPQFDQPEWKDTLQFYVDLMKDAGPQGASSNGFNENLALFQQGKCGMWIDATSAGSFVTGKDSTVADKVGFALAPDKGLGKRGNWLWAWTLAIPAGTKKAEAAEKFVSWATNKAYLDLVASKEGWANVPPGTRSSLYAAGGEYEKAAPFAKMTMESMNAADPTKPTVKPVPYTGVQFVAIPEFQGLGTTVGQLFSAALAGQMTVDDALKQAQDAATATMTEGGYIQ
jgi:sorbitol/mannitol transport system substrate-binding protein